MILLLNFISAILKYFLQNIAVLVISVGEWGSRLGDKQIKKIESVGIQMDEYPKRFGTKESRGKISYCLVKMVSARIKFSLFKYYCKILTNFLDVIVVSLNTSTAVLAFSVQIYLFLRRIIKRWEITTVPGARLLAIADFLYKKEIVTGVFEQIVGEWREEYYLALHDKRPYKAKWTSVAGHYRFYAAVIKQSPIGELYETILKIVK